MNYFTNDDIMRLESKAAKIRKEVVKMLCMAKWDIRVVRFQK